MVWIVAIGLERRLRAAATTAVMVMVVVCAPGLAAGQGLSAGQDKDVGIESANGDYRLQIGALIQMDGRFAVDDPLHLVTDTLLLRRVRPILQGRVAKYFDFRLMPDFANSTVVLFDAYLDTRFSNAFRLRVGKDKTPIGFEQLLAAYSLLFPERTLATNLVPNRDVGIQLQGEVRGGLVSYAGGLFNGVPDATNGDTDSNSTKELAGRVTTRPFVTTSVAALQGLGFALAGSHGRQAGALPSFRTTDQQLFFAYSPAATADGIRTRVSPSAFYFYKVIGAFGEYVRSAQAVSNGTSRADLAHTAWEATASVVATGEPASDRGVTPQHLFDPANGTWGALQIAARYSTLRIDPHVFAVGLATAGASREATAVGVSAIWYLNPYVKYVLSAERTVFDGRSDGPRKAEHAIVFRVQLNFQPS